MVKASEVRVRLLKASDDRSGFRSGNIDIDRFFHCYAGQNQFRLHIGANYVAETGNRIVGFVTVSSGELTAEKIGKTLKRRLPAYPIPVLRLARLAVDHHFQGHGIGKLLLKSVFELALDIRNRVGCFGVVVDAKPAVIEFYSGLGFSTLEVVRGTLGDRPEPVPMFLPIKTITKAAGR